MTADGGTTGRRRTTAAASAAVAIGTALVAVAQGEPAWLLPVAVAALAAGDIVATRTRQLAAGVAVAGAIATGALLVGHAGQVAVPVAAAITCAAAGRRRSVAPAVLAPAAAAVAVAVVVLPAGRFLPLALLAWSAAVVALLAVPEAGRPGAIGTPQRRPVAPRVLAGIAVVAVAAPLLARVVPDPPGSGEPRIGGGAVDGPAPAAASGALRSTDRMDTGERFPADDREVLRVRADRPSLWRGQVFDTWDGRSWTVAPGPIDRDRVTARTEYEAATRYGIDLEEQRMTVVAPTDVLVGAPRLVDHAAPVRTQRDRDGSILADRPMPPGTTYRVTSAVLKVSTVELAAAGDGTAGPDPGERYRALPPVPARVAELARSLTADAPTTLAKVQAVERWLGANVTYTLDIPPLPAGADAVDRFLFEDRRGYCQQVASAFAVLLRVAGVPTRIATGVVAGDRDDLTGEWAVRARDAHAWVEVWFDGIGWQGIDPTASVPLGG